MPRTIWLALVCLVVVCALIALRTGTGARAIASRTDAAPPPPTEEDGPPLGKSDRLPSPPLDRTEATASVPTVKIAPEPPAAKVLARPPERRTAAREREITGWHWHAGSKSIKRTSEPRSERER